LRNARSYIIYSYLKYILISTLIFLFLVWISQILRIVNIQSSFYSQIIDIFLTSLFALPSFINPLLPLLIIFSCIFFNLKLIGNNEIIIFKQYLAFNNYRGIFFFTLFTVAIFFFINGEIISPKSYSKYKVKEIEIRNNFNLGIPSNNQLDIKDELRLFFKNTDENFFYDVEAIIYNDNQFIISEKAQTKINDDAFNINFINGKRITFENNEKSYTVFDKLNYVVKKKEIDKLLYDRDHYNTLELINHNEKDFEIHGHYRIFNYLFLLTLLISSKKIIFNISTSQNYLFNNSILIILSVILLTKNLFLSNLFINSNITLLHYYLFSIIGLLLYNLYIHYFYVNS